MIEPIENYRLRKLIYQIMFNFYEDNYDEDPSVYKLVVIESLKNIVEFHVNQNDLSDNVKNNINKFLQQARYYNDENRIKRIELINETIILLNSQEKDDSLMFYRLQLYSRTKDFKYLFKTSDAEIKNKIEYIHDSICNDLFVLVSHTDDVDDIEFVKEYLPYLKDLDLYYDSINIILKENPLVFKDKTFYDRMMSVLTINDFIDEEVAYYNKKLIKKINKKVRRIK